MPAKRKMEHRLRLSKTSLRRLSQAGFVAAALMTTGLFFLASLSACLSSTEIDMKKAKQLLVEKKPAAAVVLFDRVVEKEGEKPRAAEAAMEAAKIYQYDLKKFDQSLHNYRIVISRSNDAAARREAQMKVAAILFYDVQDFALAVTEYSRLLELQHTTTDEIEWRSRIAKAYYYQGNYYQSRVEVDRVLKIATDIADEEAIYQAFLLKANIHVGAKEHDEAAKVLGSMSQKFPERAKKDSIPLMLAVAYEEQRDFQKAIEVLEKVRDYDPRKSFIDEKIRSLKERQGQQPGARGFRK